MHPVCLSNSLTSGLLRLYITSVLLYIRLFNCRQQRQHNFRQKFISTLYQIQRLQKCRKSDHPACTDEASQICLAPPIFSQPSQQISIGTKDSANSIHYGTSSKAATGATLSALRVIGRKICAILAGGPIEVPNHDSKKAVAELRLTLFNKLTDEKDILSKLTVALASIYPTTPNVSPSRISYLES